MRDEAGVRHAEYASGIIDFGRGRISVATGVGAWWDFDNGLCGFRIAQWAGLSAPFRIYPYRSAPSRYPL